MSVHCSQSVFSWLQHTRRDWVVSHVIAESDLTVYFISRFSGCFSFNSLWFLYVMIHKVFVRSEFIVHQYVGCCRFPFLLTIVRESFVLLWRRWDERLWIWWGGGGGSIASGLKTGGGAGAAGAGIGDTAGRCPPIGMDNPIVAGGSCSSSSFICGCTSSSSFGR